METVKLVISVLEVIVKLGAITVDIVASTPMD